MRAVNFYRNLPLDRADDIQRIINDKPSTCEIMRQVKRSTVNGATWQSITTFQCRIDPLKPRITGITEYSTTAGLAASTNFVLIALKDQDVDGNVVDIKHRDTAIVDGVSYKVTNVLTNLAYKIEALVVITE